MRRTNRVEIERELDSHNVKSYQLSKPLTSRFDDMSIEQVWCVYNDISVSDHVRDLALQQMLWIQDRMLIQRALYIWRAKKKSADLGDFIGYARMSAIKSYNDFNIELGNKLSTYTYRIVTDTLKTISEEITFVKSNSCKRQWRNYFLGKMDNNPETKTAFESRYEKQLNNRDKIEEIKDHCRVLNAEMVSYDDYITNDDGRIVDREFVPLFEPVKTNIFEELGWSDAVNKLNDIQKTVYQMFFVDQYSVPEIVSETGIEAKIVKREVQRIKNHFKEIYPDLVPKDETEMVRKKHKRRNDSKSLSLAA